MKNHTDIDASMDGGRVEQLNINAQLPIFSYAQLLASDD
jgi:hypothetical protein